MTRADIVISGAEAATSSGGGTNYLIKANNGHFYRFYMDRQSDLNWIKSTDGGYTWTIPTVVVAGTVLAIATWYDRWSGRSTDKIRIAYTDSVSANINYRDMDTASSDTLSSEITVFDGASTATGGALTICTGRNGHIRIAGSIDAGAEDGAWSSADDGATWGDTIADPSEAATQDQYYLLPGWNADTADMMLVFVDASANGISVKRYDDSADTWTETAIIADASFTDQVATTAFPHVAVVCDTVNSRNIVACWNAIDALNADLRVFIINDSAINETSANCVLNSTDDQGFCAIAIDTDVSSSLKWYVFYGGKSDGSETFSTALKVYYKTTTDDGATWSAETALTLGTRDINDLFCTPVFNTTFLVGFHNNIPDVDNYVVSVVLPSGGGITAPLLAGGVIA